MNFFHTYIVKNARIFNGCGYQNGSLAVANGKITAVGDFPLPKDADVIDGSGRLLTPGLVDIHTHLKNISSDVYGADASLCTLPFGVTAAVDAGAGRGDKAYLDTLSPDTAVFIEIKSKNDAPCLDGALERAASYGDRFAGIKIYLDTSSPEVKSLRLLETAVDFAGVNHFRVMVHTTGTPAPMRDVVKALRKGDILTHAYHGGEHNVRDENFAAIFLAKEKGVVVDTGMACHIHTDFDVLAKAIERGALPDTISTDITKLSVYMRGGRYGLTTCMSICRHLGMREEDILKCVTVNAANAVGRPAWGRLAVGGDATFAVIDTERRDRFSAVDRAGNHIEGVDCYRCLLTAVKGEILYRD